MAGLHLMIPEHGAFDLGAATPVLTFGRASSNDIVLADPSLSRHHALLRWEGGIGLLEDLGSHNGTFVNGRRIQGPMAVAPGDEIVLGRVGFRVEGDPLDIELTEDPPSDDSGSSLYLSFDELSTFRGPGDDAQEARRLRRALHLIHAFSLELMHEVPLEDLLPRLLAKVSRLMKPNRSAILLREANGTLTQALAWSAKGTATGPLDLSQAMLAAALERHEAMLVNDPGRDARFATSESLIRSGVVSIMTVPLVHDGEIGGLLYMDATASREPFTAEDLQVVASLAHLAAARVRQARTAEGLRQAKVMEYELTVARRIQERLLPEEVPALPGFELFGRNHPCRQVSGDLFGFFPRRDGRMWVVLADVSGKGIGAGLLMAAFQAYLRAWTDEEDDPAELAGRISAELAHRTTINRYITAFICLLDPATGLASCTSAGHNPIPVFRRDGRRELIESMGFPLALFPGTPYRCAEVALRPGDLMFIYTDGISEAEAPDGTEFGLEGVAAVLGAHPEASLGDLHQALEAALDQHTRGAPLADDRTLVLLRR